MPDQKQKQQQKTSKKQQGLKVMNKKHRRLAHWHGLYACSNSVNIRVSRRLKITTHWCPLQSGTSPPPNPRKKRRRKKTRRMRRREGDYRGDKEEEEEREEKEGCGVREQEVKSFSYGDTPNLSIWHKLCSTTHGPRSAGVTFPTSTHALISSILHYWQSTIRAHTSHDYPWLHVHQQAPTRLIQV